VVGLDGERHGGVGLVSQHFDDSLARCSEQGESDRSDESVGDEVKLLVGHMAEHRQRQYPMRDFIGLRQPPLRVPAPA
jgi:hypothetical protein